MKTKRTIESCTNTHHLDASEKLINAYLSRICPKKYNNFHRTKLYAMLDDKRRTMTECKLSQRYYPGLDLPNKN